MLIHAPEGIQYSLLAGVDEVGRGPLAGDVVAAAVILDQAITVPGLADSKKLSEARREQLYDEIVGNAKAWAVGRASVSEIDEINILQASLLAMTRAVRDLPIQPDFVLVDGNKTPPWDYPCMAVVKGDGKILSIAAASILAKVTRDREMKKFDQTYPGYGLAKHKGYPTADHLQALTKLGPCPLHRRSFGPVARLLASAK